MGLKHFLFKRRSLFSASVNDLNKIKNLKPTITFDDVLLEPQYSEINTRKEANTSVKFLAGFPEMSVPVVSANMDSVTGLNMAKAMNDVGGVGILHRYQSKEDTLSQIRELSNYGAWAIPSVGVQDGEYDKALEYMAAGADAICIDIAHGHSKRMVDLVRKLSKKNIKVIAGNVATYNGALQLADAGANVIKVGIGGGSMCSTRVVTGHGVPQLSALTETGKVKKLFKNLTLIADGGIRNSGDIAKALAFGADVVMLGSLLAGTLESPGEIINGKKFYRGMASRDARVDFDPNLAYDYVPEGVVTMKPVEGPVSHVIGQLIGGVRSAMSYTGAWNLKEFRKKARIMMVTSASFIEGTPHGLSKG